MFTCSILYISTNNLAWDAISNTIFLNRFFIYKKNIWRTAFVKVRERCPELKWIQQ